MDMTTNRNIPGRHLVIGTGPIGSATALRLADQGHEVVVVTRSGTGPARPGIELIATDASDVDALTKLAKGATAIYNCANPPYNRWVTDWPPLANSILAAAESADAVLVTMSNLYGYGRPDGPMTESDPLAAKSRKGRVRAGIWNDALAAHTAGRVRTTEARASDFIGPGLGDGSHMGSRVTDKVRAGRSVSVVGSPDQPHSWTAVADVARMLAILGTDERAWGRAWHVPTAKPLTQREMVHALCDAAGRDHVKVKGLPHMALRLAGLGSSSIRELVEVAYQFEAPFVIDSSAATAEFGITATPITETIDLVIRASTHG